MAASVDLESDAGMDRIHGWFDELESMQCARQQGEVATRLASHLHRYMMLDESMLHRGLVRSQGGPGILDRRVVYAGYLTVERLRVRLADHAIVTREIEHHGNAVAVLPYDPVRRCGLIVRLFRAPVFSQTGLETLDEACAGMIGRESEEEATRREAFEELGVSLTTLESVARVWPSPGVSTERQSLFLAAYAAADRNGKGGGVAGEHEGITVVERSLDDLAGDADAGRVTDGKLFTLILTLRSRRPDLFAGSHGA